MPGSSTAKPGAASSSALLNSATAFKPSGGVSMLDARALRPTSTRGSRARKEAGGSGGGTDGLAGAVVWQRLWHGKPPCTLTIVRLPSTAGRRVAGPQHRPAVRPVSAVPQGKHSRRCMAGVLLGACCLMAPLLAWLGSGVLPAAPGCSSGRTVLH